MPTFAHAVEIAAGPVPLFTLTQDYEQRLDWDPFLKEARLLDHAQRAGLGVRAHCVAHSGLGMETEYVSFTPPRITAVKMTRGPFFLESFAGSWRFEPIGPDRSTVTFSYHLEARPRWLRWLLNPILQWVFARDTRRRLQALKQAAETTNILARYSAAQDD